MLEKMYLSRFFEEKLKTEFSEGNLYGTTHLSIGQEASHVGLCSALLEGDWIVPTHRCHGFNIASGSNMVAMFWGCESFNQDLSNWNLSNVTENRDIFIGCPIKEEYKPKFK